MKKIVLLVHISYSEDYYIKLKNNFLLPIFDDSNCKSVDLIYLIKCKKCFSFYVGETSNLKDRIYNHLYSIKKFEPFNEKKFTVVCAHFNSKGHNWVNDIVFYVIKIGLNDRELRLKYETFFINLFRKLNINLMNDYIPDMDLIRKNNLCNMSST